MTKFIPGKQLGIVLDGRRGSSDVSLEVYVDFLCPFSKRCFARLRDEVKPHYGPKLEIIIMPFPQPWHPSSAMVHEAFHAACMVAPDRGRTLLSETMEFDWSISTM